MKAITKVTIIVLSFLFTQASFGAETETTASQAEMTSGIKLTPMLGFTFFSVVGADDNALGEDTNSGVMAGVLAGMNLGPVDIESGIMYLETGASVSTIFGSVDTTISYLALPVYVKAPVFETGGIDFYAKGGVLAAFKVDAKQEGSGFLEGLEGDLNDEVNGFDVLGQLGLGGNYVIQPNMTVGGELSFVRGFTEVVKDAGGYNQGYSAAATLTISI